MKNILIIFIVSLAFISQTFAESVADTIGVDIQALSCPSGEAYKICWGINADLHTKFIASMKKKDAQKAIQYWDAMIKSVDGDVENDSSFESYLANPLIGTFAPEWVSPMPSGRIFAKKAFKWGILYLWTDSIQDADFSLYYVGYMRYKEMKNGGMLYFYNNQIAPEESLQYKKYLQIYWSHDYSNFEKDLSKSFYRWRFWNAQVNAIYQRMIRAIR